MDQAINSYVYDYIKPKSFVTTPQSLDIPDLCDAINVHIFCCLLCCHICYDLRVNKILGRAADSRGNEQYM